MIKIFKVKNFKNFRDELILDLGRVNNYEFNQCAIRNNIVKNALVYGENGSGKTNLGYAIMDITLHLVDRQKHLEEYTLYNHLDNSDKVCFTYQFQFGEEQLEYYYEKRMAQVLEYERVLINGSKVLEFNYNKGYGSNNLKGAETLKTTMTEKNISYVRYVYNNSILEDNSENKVFAEFMEFVGNMLHFSSLERNQYQGFLSYGGQSIAEGIIERNKVVEFQEFLKRIGIHYQLAEREIDGQKKIYCIFEEREVDFFKVASKGTKSFALFYYWFIQMEKVSFVFVDEFDAFYHSNLSREVVKSLIALENTQSILTTHNTDIMTNDLLRPDCYLQIVDGGIKSFSDSTEKEIRKAHNLQKMYKGGVFSQNEQKVHSDNL